MQVPASSAPKEKLPVGAQVQLSNGMVAKVLEVTDEHITIDANPELAGQSLTFDVELVKLQKVSAASPGMAGTKLLVAAQERVQKRRRAEPSLDCCLGLVKLQRISRHYHYISTRWCAPWLWGLWVPPVPPACWQQTCWSGAAAEGDDRRLLTKLSVGLPAGSGWGAMLLPCIPARRWLCQSARAAHLPLVGSKLLALA